jgi:hypothetical protein
VRRGSIIELVRALAMIALGAATIFQLVGMQMRPIDRDDDEPSAGSREHRFDEAPSYSGWDAWPIIRIDGDYEVGSAGAGIGGRGRVRFDSCAVAKAVVGFDALELIPDTWVDG